MEFEHSVRSLRSEVGFFTGLADIFICRAPGRLDLMGGNDDYTGGLVFETTIGEATYAAAQLSGDQRIMLRNKTAEDAGWKGEIQITLDELRDLENLRRIVNASKDLRWTAYVLGNLHWLLQKYPGRIASGIRLYMESNLPLNRGVSSSAAIEVAVMKASAAAYGIDLCGVELALACQWVENVIAGSACGIMDQVTVVLGQEGFMLPLVCQPCLPEPLVRLPDKLQVFGIDSGVSHQVAGVEYEAARAAAFMGYKIICDHENIAVSLEESADIPRYTDKRWNGYLANLPRSQFRAKYEDLLPPQLDKSQYLRTYGFHTDPFTPLQEELVYRIRANTRYAVEENQRVQLFVELCRTAAPAPRAYELMGELMYQSHYAYTECGLGAKATDFLVGLCRRAGLQSGIYGAKITGGGAGGTVAILASNDAKASVDKIFDEYAAAGFGEPFLFEGSSAGADSYGVLVISKA